MVRLWERSRAATTWLGVAGLLAFPASAALLGWLYLRTHQVPEAIGLSGELGVVTVVGISLGLCLVTAVAHELVHMAAMLTVGRRPRLHYDSIPYVRLGVDRLDRPYTRGAFVWVSLAPVVLITGLLVWGVVSHTYAGWLIVPAAFHITASKMDIAYSIIALRQPRGTRCRVGDDGLELTEPIDFEVP